MAIHSTQPAKKITNSVHSECSIRVCVVPQPSPHVSKGATTFLSHSSIWNRSDATQAHQHILDRSLVVICILTERQATALLIRMEYFARQASNVFAASLTFIYSWVNMLVSLLACLYAMSKISSKGQETMPYAKQTRFLAKGIPIEVCLVHLTERTAALVQNVDVMSTVSRDLISSKACKAIRADAHVIPSDNDLLEPALDLILEL